MQLDKTFLEVRDKYLVKVTKVQETTYFKGALL